MIHKKFTKYPNSPLEKGRTPKAGVAQYHSAVRGPAPPSLKSVGAPSFLGTF